MPPHPFWSIPTTQTLSKGLKASSITFSSNTEGPSLLKHASDKLRSTLTSKLASGVRLGAGIKARHSRKQPTPPSQQPDLPLILYSFESSPFSRPVREKLCELELTYILINLGKQQFSDMGPAQFHWSLKPYKPLPNTKRDEFFKQHGNVQVPYLMDPNTGIDMFESKDILRYLEERYG